MRIYIFILLLFVLNSCHKTAYHEAGDRTVDPFKLFTPDFNQAQEQNDIFQEWSIHSPFLGIHKNRFLSENKKDSIWCVVSGVPQFPAAYYFLAEYRMPLPEKAKRMEITLEYGAHQLDFPVSEYDADVDSGLFFQTLFFNKTTLLKSKTVPLEETYSRDDGQARLKKKKIRIRVPSSADNIVMKLKIGMGTVLLSSCRIQIDGKDIEQYAYDQTLPFSSSELKEIQAKLSSRPEIPDRARITGIGESLHGSKEFTRQAVSIIKGKIADGGNYVLLLEASPLLGFQINQYVHQKEKTLPAELVTMEKNGYNIGCFTEFLGEIKEHNRENPGKVIIASYDLLIPADTSLDSLFYRVAAVFPESEEMQNCIDLIKGKGNYIDRNLADSLLLQLDRAIKKSVDERLFYQNYLYNCLRERADNSGSMKDFHFDYMDRRDSLMANNVCFLLEALPDSYKAIVHGHWGHVAREQDEHFRTFNGSFTSSMGYYLSQKYGSDYTVIGLFTGCGNVWTGRYEGYDVSLKKGVYPVSKPIGKSLEQLCDSLGETSFYLNDVRSLSLLDKIIYRRSMGIFWNPMQFEPADLRQEVDIIWFTKESNAF
jgi:erythromycin esterase